MAAIPRRLSRPGGLAGATGSATSGSSFMVFRRHLQPYPVEDRSELPGEGGIVEFPGPRPGQYHQVEARAGLRAPGVEQALDPAAQAVADIGLADLAGDLEADPEPLRGRERQHLEA